MTMLDQNVQLNEYDFVLFHLYKAYPEYREYYKGLRKSHPDRLMILDNSAYEFFVKGESLNLDEFVEVIRDLQPDLYILPDVLMDADKTNDLVDEFLGRYGKYLCLDCKVKSQPMAVVQGNSPYELFDLALHYRDLCIDNIAIPFHNSFFQDYVDDHTANQWRLEMGQITPDHRYALGRINFINKAELLLSRFKHVHLLGSHCPFEKRYYNQKLIKTMDTGYPVKCGIAGYNMGDEPKKPDIIIDDFMTVPLTRKQQILIESNINRFKLI